MLAASVINPRPGIKPLREKFGNCHFKSGGRIKYMMRSTNNWSPELRGTTHEGQWRQLHHCLGFTPPMSPAILQVFSICKYNVINIIAKLLWGGKLRFVTTFLSKGRREVMSRYCLIKRLVEFEVGRDGVMQLLEREKIPIDVKGGCNTMQVARMVRAPPVCHGRKERWWWLQKGGGLCNFCYKCQWKLPLPN